MELVVDANILFSALLKRGITSDLLSDKRLRLFAPSFLLEELSKHKEYLITKTERSDEEFQHLISILKRRIRLCSLAMYYLWLPDAERICPDVGDTPYFAVALKLRIPVWSNDKKLEEQQVVKIVSTRELADAFPQQPY